MEENTIINTEQENNDSVSKYLEAIEEMKKNSIDRKYYNELKQENEQLLNTLINNGQIEAPESKVDVNMLRKELYSGDSSLSNLDYWTKTLALRNETIKTTGKDPFCPGGSKIIATEEDLAAAERVATGIQHCIDVADGDNSIFTNELQRIMVDTMPIRNSSRKR